MLSNPTVARRLLKEIARLRTQPPEGIRIRTSDDDILDVTGIIAGPAGTPYDGGYFRVKFNFTHEFPAVPPNCRMLTKIFHPNVSASGEICVNTLKKDWKSTYGIEHILVTVKCLLIYPNAESALDEDAGQELLEDYENYCSRARLITSVHATPKTPPPEFDIPSVIPEDKPSESSPRTPETREQMQSAAKPSSTTAKSATTSRTSPPLTMNPTDTNTLLSPPTAITALPPTTLLVQSSNTKSENDPARIVYLSTKPRSKGPNSNSSPLVPVVSNPPPLQPSTNVPHHGKEPVMSPIRNMDTLKAILPDKAKAIKRTAAGAAAGADKRKKALKRL